MLELKNLCVSYRKQPVVHNVSFGVQPGQIVGLVGESGSGKSTIVRSMLGLLAKGGQITSGEIFFDNQKISAFSKKDWTRIRGKEISMIFQYPERSMDPVISIGNQFCESMKASRRLEKKEVLEHAAALLSELHLDNPERILRSYPFELSGGMCQRVAVAMAMVNNPRLLLADEPTSALDVTVQAQTIDVMMELRRKYGTAILLVTHNMGVIAHMADMVGVVYHGELVEWGRRKEVLYSPAHPYTKALIRAIPTMDGKLPEYIQVTENMPYTIISETHWAGTQPE